MGSQRVGHDWATFTLTILLGFSFALEHGVSFLFVCFKLPHNCMLKILQARLQQYVNWELPDVQAGFRKGRGSTDQIANIHWTTEKAREFQKNTYFCFIDHVEDFDCVDHRLCGSQTVENTSRYGNTRPPYLPPEKSGCCSRSNS